MRIYISGAITGTNDYMQRFLKAEENLKSDYSVVNPAVVCSMLPTNFTHSEYMDVCLVLLEKCDSIYMLKGWETSKGANIELTYAKNRKMNILYEENEDER